MKAWISALGLWKTHQDLFDLMLLPDALDREDIIDGILMDTAELELLYSDPGFLKKAIGLWSRKRLPIWNELEATLHYEYNPIHNYDRTEQRNLGLERSGTSSSSSKGVEDGFKAGYDSGELVNSDQAQTSASGEAQSREEVGEEEKTRAYGNIGVTTTQQMIQAQREVVRFDIGAFISNDFKEKFCLQVY